MDRREFHKTTLAAAAAAATAGAGEPAAPPAVPADVHPGDAPPPGAKARLGTTRFNHLVERGNEGLCALAFSPDGRTLAALGLQDNAVSLWAVPSGRLVAKWDGFPADRGGDLAFSPCGRFLAQAGEGVRVWDLAGERFLWDDRETSWNTDALAYTPDGRMLVVSDGIAGTVTVRDAASGRVLRTFAADPHPVESHRRADWFYAVAVSPDGRFAAAGSQYELLHDLGRGAGDTGPLYDRIVREYGCYSTTQTGDGRTYALEPRGRVWVWELATGRVAARFEGHTHPVRRVAFTPTGELISVGAGGATNVWDVAAGARLRELVPGGAGYVAPAVVVLPGGRGVLVGGAGGPRVIDPRTGAVRADGLPPWEAWWNFAASADGRWLAASPGRDQIDLWDAAAGRDCTPADRHTGWVQAVGFSADGRRVVTLAGREAFVWDADTGRRLHAHRGPAWLAEWTLARSPAGDRWACLGREHYDPKDQGRRRSLFVWDDRTGETWTRDLPGAALFAWAADGRGLVVATEDGVSAVPLGGDAPPRPFDPPGGPLAALAVSPDGRTVAGLQALPTDREKTPTLFLHLWDAATGKLAGRLDVPDHPLPPRHQNWSARPDVRFAPDGRTVAATFGHGVVYAGPVGGPRLERRFLAPWPNEDGEQGVGAFAVTFLPDGRLIAAGSDGTAEDEGYGPYVAWVWDVDTGKELWASPPRRHVIAALAFSPDGRTLAAGSWDTTTLLWDLGPVLARR